MATLVNSYGEHSLTFTFHNLKTNTPQNTDNWIGYTVGFARNNKPYVETHGALHKDHAAALSEISGDYYDFSPEGCSLELSVYASSEDTSMLTIFAANEHGTAQALRILADADAISAFSAAIKAEYDAVLADKPAPVPENKPEYRGGYADEYIKSSLEIVGHDLSNDEITLLLGLEPTEAINAGDVKRMLDHYSRAPLLYDFNYWGLKSDLPLEADIDQHLEHLLHRVSHCREALAKIGETHTVRLSVYGNRYYFHLGASINTDIVAKAAAVNAEIDISFYAFDKDYLETREQKDELAKVLMNTKVGKSSNMTTAEALAIADALALYEQLHPQMLAAISDLMDRFDDDEERDKALAAAVLAAGKLQRAFIASKHLAYKGTSHSSSTGPA